MIRHHFWCYKIIFLSKHHVFLSNSGPQIKNEKKLKEDTNIYGENFENDTYLDPTSGPKRQNFQK